MKRSEMLEQNSVASDELIKKSGSWTNSEGEIIKFDCFVKAELSYGNLERIQRAYFDNEAVRMTRIVHEAIRFGDEGEEIWSDQFIQSLKFGLVQALYKCYAEIHGDETGKKPTKEEKATTH